MAHYLLRYSVVPDHVTRRVPYRGAHLAHAQAAVARGELILAGGLEDVAQGAVLLFTGHGPENAEAFARGDPYVVEGLVTNWRVDRWLTVVGADAAEPLPA